MVGAVVDAVLYEPNLSKEVSLRRAKAILSIGGIFKSVEADESDEERRELERLVMNAASGKKKEKAAAEKKKAGGGFWHHGGEEPKEGVPVDVKAEPKA